MFFGHLPHVAAWIRRTHSTFAGLPAADCLQVLGRLNYQISNSAQIGATYTAMTDAQHGSLNTLLYVGRDDRGGWIIQEQINRAGE